MKIIEDAIKLGACRKTSKAKDMKSLDESVFLVRKGGSFVWRIIIPDLETFRSLDVEQFNIFIDKKCRERK